MNRIAMLATFAATLMFAGASTGQKPPPPTSPVVAGIVDDVDAGAVDAGFGAVDDAASALATGDYAAGRAAPPTLAGVCIGCSTLIVDAPSSFTLPFEMTVVPTHSRSAASVSRSHVSEGCTPVLMPPWPAATVCVTDDLTFDVAFRYPRPRLAAVESRAAAEDLKRLNVLWIDGPPLFEI